MLETTVDRAAEKAEDNLPMPCNGSEHSSDIEITVDNDVEIFDKKKQKENYSDGMKVHNFTECCR